MKMFPIATLSLLCASTLVGCAAIQADQARYQAQLQAADQAKCEGYGFQPNTNAFANCMMKLDRERQWQQADSARQANENRQREADRQAVKDAAEAQSRDSQPEEMDGFIPKSAEDGFTPKQDEPVVSDPVPDPVPPDTNCTTTTTTTQTDNAGNSTTTTECND